MEEMQSTCCYCGVGCGVIIQTEHKQVIGVRGDPRHPANFGRLCSKGSQLHLTATQEIKAQVRLLQPQMRTRRDQALKASDWETTLAFLTEKIATTVEEFGPDSMAFYVSGQLLTEDYYVFNKLAKALLGTNNIDSNSRLCMSSAVVGYKQSLGSDAPPTCYEDLEQAECVFIIGANPVYAHPIVYRRLEEARQKNPNLKLIVVDPRRTETASDADLFLQITPGTDVALLNGMLYLCLWEGMIAQDFIEAHTEGFEVLRDTVRDYTPSVVAKLCGISEAALMQATRYFARSKATLSLYCQGLNQSSSGSAKNSALINLHLVTGQIAKVGAGPFSLTGQPNAMGGREVGAMANLMSGHRDLASAEDRAELAAMWGVSQVPEKPGKTAVEMFEALRKGEIKIVWIVCTNPAQSMPDQNLVRAALENAELVIVQEAYGNTATVAFADVLLPATTWSEKSGTVSNSERRISRVNAVLEKPGLAWHDWEIAVQFARRLEQRWGRSERLFPFGDPEEIWNEHRLTTQGRDLDISGLSYPYLAQHGPQQWPFPAGATTGAQRLYQDRKFATASGRARLINVAYQAPVDKVTARFPFVLNTGRLRDQWHGMSRTGTVAKLFAHAPEAVLDMCAQDMQRRFFKEGDLLKVSNTRGEQIFAVKSSEDVRQGQVFVAMHWGEEFVSGRSEKGVITAGINSLSSPAFDPQSKQPELKFAAVKIEKVDLPWRLVLYARMASKDALRVLTALRPFMREFSYAQCTPLGGDAHGIVFSAASNAAPAPGVIESMEALLGLEGPDTLRYDDARRGHGRHILREDGKLKSLALIGDVSAAEWLKSLWLNETDVSDLGRQLLMPNPSMGMPVPVKDKLVCTCFNVSEVQIHRVLESTNSVNSGDEREACAPLDHLKTQLKCGTNCGSCVPALKKIIVDFRPSVTTA